MKWQAAPIPLATLVSEKSRPVATTFSSRSRREWVSATPFFEQFLQIGRDYKREEQRFSGWQTYN